MIGRKIKLLYRDHTQLNCIDLVKHPESLLVSNSNDCYSKNERGLGHRQVETGEKAV